MLILELLAQTCLPDTGLTVDQRDTSSTRRGCGQRLAQLPEHLLPANKRRGRHVTLPPAQPGKAAAPADNAQLGSSA